MTFNKILSSLDFMNEMFNCEVPRGPGLSDSLVFMGLKMFHKKLVLKKLHGEMRERAPIHGLPIRAGLFEPRPTHQAVVPGGALLTGFRAGARINGVPGGGVLGC